MSEFIRYYYFGRTEKGNVNGIVTCATSLNGNKVHVGFAFCSPKDTFKKDMGRRIAAGRLVSNPVILTFSGHSGDDIANYIRDSIITNTLKMSGFPNWVKRISLNYGITHPNKDCKYRNNVNA